MKARTVSIVLIAVAATTIVLAALVAWLNLRDDADASTTSPPASSAAAASAERTDLVARGAYLVRAGSCVGCHTERGGAPFAGGRAIDTPFGVISAPNITADPATGLGAWNADDFWRALHNGRSRGGRLLYPAFPYPNYTRLARADADAMYAYLRTVTPVVQKNKPHALTFPFDLQASLAVWRALFFRPAHFGADASQSPEWNRGAYLVETLGHCNACHSSRNAFGATPGPFDLAGGLIPIQNWYAPSLNDRSEAGVAEWDAADVIALLKTGVSPRGSVQGPMAEVVGSSTQFLDDADLAAMTAYLQALPPTARPAHDVPAAASTATVDERARGLYDDHCAGCHGKQGEGVAGAYPPLAGNRAVAMTPSANLVHIVLQGGFAPATAGNPRPFGMPPFATVLADADLAELLTFLRGSWGNHAAPVSALEVARYRGTTPR